MSIIISADEIKKTLPGYMPTKVEELHLESTKIADLEFKHRLKDRNVQNIILMCGGTASGKSEFVSEYLTNVNAVILDGTLSNPHGAEVKIRNSLKKNKNVNIKAVFPADINKAFIAFLNRDRQFSDRHFYRTHTGCRRTLLHVSEIYPNVEIDIYESIYKKKTVYFELLSFKNKSEQKKYISAIQYTEKQLLDIINKS